ncbi:ligase-associated DNA damage response DEXH box helicase [Alphaproteobacteria bacterium]|nr:ligase-associated DNA damage response DEXH box helicase [Alphaproteobacteria bacterium]
MAKQLPQVFGDWFEGRGWAPHRHQKAMLKAGLKGEDCLLIAPTGGGKTLAGFLPSLVDLYNSPTKGLHTLYISPLKALTVDIHRNLTLPVEEMGLDVTIETRTGDTPSHKRQRQRKKPPSILLTTPESFALLLSYTDARKIFGSLKCLIIDELHALTDNKRGDLLALGLARLNSLAPEARRVGLSATVADPAYLQRWLAPFTAKGEETTKLILGKPGPKPKVSILQTKARMPWSGHMALHAVDEIYALIKDAKTAIVFVNTRAQAELIFRALWSINEDGLSIALHHGSLSPEQRRKVEAAMAKGLLQAVVATSSLDLGIDWGDVDLVVQVGAPKGVSRLLQRIGRSNHQFDKSSRAVLVPANRFETLECQAAIDGVKEHTLDGALERDGGMDVLAQHLIGTACSEAFDPDQIYEDIHNTATYSYLTRKDFNAILHFVSDGGYALRAYDQYKRLVIDEDGHYKIAHQRFARQYRMNVGTIVEAPTLRVKLGRKTLGEVEEYFAQMLEPGDTFIFAGQLLQFKRIREIFLECTAGGFGTPKVPAYGGGRLPLSTHLADRVRTMLQDPSYWRTFPKQVRDWLSAQRDVSVTPNPDSLLVESFPRADREYLVAYCFAGRNAHQTLGMLLTKRMERLGLGPLGFVATDYVIATWSLRAPNKEQLVELFNRDMLGDDLEDWIQDSSLLKRTFRNCTVIAGLIERRHPGEEKTRKQVTISTDLIYDVLRRHEPDHILLRATWADAAAGLTDVARLSDLLSRYDKNLELKRLDKVSPMAVPILLEIGRESVYGSAQDELLDEGSDGLIAEAMG